jgi:hypothetical protein
MNMAKLKAKKTVTVEAQGNGQENIQKAIAGVAAMNAELKAKKSQPPVQEPEAVEPPSEEEVEFGDRDGSEDGDGQEIIEVSQEEVKKALKALLTTHNDIIALLYRKHDEYNKQYFNGELSVPIITIDKLNNRTLGNYTEGKDRMALENHIRFNQNFIALNTEERILETLRHEMIHQWQDEVLYAPKGVETFKPFKKATIGEDGEIAYVDAVQKKRPKDWHNADFKEMAAVVGIPAIGSKCYGNPAKMPEPKSYNRKFRCACVASNGYPVTIWSTREIHAVCQVCGEEFVEVNKENAKAITIEVNTSHVEKPGQDAVMDAMKQKYHYFERFDSKAKKDAFLAELANETDGHKVTELEHGVYQKGHNAYGLGYRYWVAYNTSEVIPDDVHAVVDDTKVDEDPVEQPKPKKGGKRTKKVEDSKEKEPAPSEEEVTQAPEAPEAPDNVVPFPTPTTEGDEDVLTQKEHYDIENPQDLIDAYKLKGSTRAAAELFGVNQSTFIRRAQKYKIDFKTGTIKE